MVNKGFTEVIYNAVEARKETLIVIPVREVFKECGLYLEKLQVVGMPGAQGRH